MICKHCSTENEESAIFCKNCGKRLDGKKPCPKCNTLIDENAVYCTACGTRVDGKTVHQDCGTVYYGNFRHAYRKQQNTIPRKTTVQETNKNYSYINSILERVGTYAGLAAAALAFIFMFFMGIGLSTRGDAESIQDLTVISPTLWILQICPSINFVDCFGNNFNTFKQLTELSPDSSAIMIIPVFQTLIAVATLICTTTFLSLTVYRFVKKLRGQETKSIENMIFGTVMSFIVGALCLNSMMCYHSSIFGYSAGAQASYDLTGATVAGMVLSLIACAIMIGCKIAVNRQSLRGRLLFKTVSSAAIMLVSLILLLCLKGPISSTLAEDGYRISQTFSLILDYVEAGLPSSALIIGYVFNLMLIAILTIIVIYSAIKTVNGQDKLIHGTIFANVAFTLAIFYLIFSIMGCYPREKSALEGMPLAINALPIFVTIITAAVLATEIYGHYTTYKKFTILFIPFAFLTSLPVIIVLIALFIKSITKKYK